MIGGAGVRDIPKNSLYGQIGWKPLEGLKLDAEHIWTPKLDFVRDGAEISNPSTRVEE